MVDLPRAVRQKDVNAMHIYIYIDKEATEAIMFINNKLNNNKTITFICTNQETVSVLEKTQANKTFRT